MHRLRALDAAPSGRLPWALVIALALTGCASSSDQPAVLPPVTVTNAGPAPEGQPDGGSPSRPRPPRDPSDGRAEEHARAEEGREGLEDSDEDPTLVVLGKRRGSAPSTTREMLQRAARDARTEREQTGSPVLVLNDENLAEHAEGGRVTLGLADPPQEDEEAPDELSEKEQLWRSRVLEIRRRWREAYDSLEPLEEEAARLRTRFYSEDDPVRRDREIKPQWDRTLDRLAEAERTLTTAREELAVAIEQGRHDGAQPGWLREGIALGPFDFDEPAEGEQLDELSPTEPTVVDAQSLEPPR